MNYLTAKRIHVKIFDAANQVYQVPEFVFPPPKTERSDAETSDLRFDYKNEPFSFTICRRSTGEVLFDSSAASLVFESQYLRIRTKLPSNPNLYGLGEATDPFRLGTDNYTRTLWNYVDGVPQNRNLYGSHPVYIDHRMSGSHGAFFFNSNGMDIRISKDGAQQYLEYNTIGGIFDLYFMAGPSPIDVATQYAEVAGIPAFYALRWSWASQLPLGIPGCVRVGRSSEQL